MSKVFIRGDKVDNDNIRVNFQHFSPLDKKDGLTEEQLKEGYLVDSIPEPEEVKGKIPQLYYSIPKKECYWQYNLDAPPAPITIADVNEKVELLMQLMLESEGLL